jgi:hypothetical protein
LHPWSVHRADVAVRAAGDQCTSGFHVLSQDKVWLATPQRCSGVAGLTVALGRWILKVLRCQSTDSGNAGSVERLGRRFLMSCPSPQGFVEATA